MNRILQGVFPVVATTFDDHGGLDLSSQGNLVNYLLAQGAHGIALFGNAGEGYALSAAERATLLKLVVKEVHGRVPIVVSTGHTGTNVATQLSQQAEDAGASALMILPPYYLRPGPDGILYYYEQISKAVKIPIIVQDAPLLTQVSMPADLLGRMAREIEGVQYVKVEAPPTAPKTSAVLSAAGGMLTVFGGLNGQFLIEELQRGARGTMPGSDMTSGYVAVWDLLERGDAAGAWDCFTPMLPLIRFELQPGMGVSAMKHNLHQKELFEAWPSGILPALSMPRACESWSSFESGLRRAWAKLAFGEPDSDHETFAPSFGECPMSLGRRSFIQQMTISFGALSKRRKAGRSTQMESGSAGAPDEMTTGNHPLSSRRAGYIRPGTIAVIHKNFDLVVVGGGISGTCAAISAARNGARVALMHERSTLGGNSSSEVRLYPENTSGFSTWCRESGIFDEIYTEERARNWEPYVEGFMNSNWDLVLYEWAMRERNLSLLLNTTMREVEMADPAHILAVHGAQLGTEKEFILEAPLFVDATGDGVLIYRSGADFRKGKEARSEYGEPLAPPKASDAVMGNTLYFRARDTGKPVHFKRPEWAAEFPTEADLTGRGHGFFEAGYWWIEVGYPMNWIHDNEAIRDEALRQLLGVWDHIKNRCTDDEIRSRARNYALEFIGFWPYKRESRRLLGDYILREEDVRNPEVHPDDIAYGVWGIDIHVPGGILKRHVPPYPPPRSDANFEERSTIPYGIPLRSCYSRNVRNLLAAGRPIGASYVAFASSRVLPTGAITGQGVGVAAALCKKHRCAPRVVAKVHAEELQQLILRQDGSIPGVENRDPGDLARSARVKASSEAALVFPESADFHAAEFPLAQLFPVSSDRLESIDLLLRSTARHPIRLTLGLRQAAHAWDFRSSEDVAHATAVVPAKSQGYTRFVFNVKTKPRSLYYVYFDRPNSQLAWALWSDSEVDPTQVPAGVTPADRPGASRWRPLTGGKSFVMRLEPEQRPFGPQNVVTGTNRPDRWTNLFSSDPSQPLPAWIELTLPAAAEFNLVQITFDDDINRRVTLPLFRYPECVKRYDVAVLSAGNWRIVAAADNNYYRRVVHSFNPVSSDRLRIAIHETNGAKAAKIYEVRIYNEPPT